MSNKEKLHSVKRIRRCIDCPNDVRCPLVSLATKKNVETLSDLWRTDEVISDRVRVRRDRFIYCMRNQSVPILDEDDEKIGYAIFK